ncbi:MAG: glycosyltransferase family 2 protein [Acidobacteriota bacterium]
MTGSYSISVVIPTYQRRESVRRLLAAFAAQTMPPQDYQVIVSIDGSEDGTREMIERLPVPFPLEALWQPNRGRATACNAGIRAARGELIVMLDDDMEPVPDFLTAHVRAHAADRRLGVLGAVPARVDAAAPPISCYIADKFNRHLANLAQAGHQIKLRDFYSGNFSIRRDILFQAGLFDESFKNYGNEDLELFLRLSKQNVCFVFCQEALAYQYSTKDLLSVARDNRAAGKTALLLSQKHPDEMVNTRLGSFHHFSSRWRTLRAGLVRLSRMVPAIPHLFLWLVQALERGRFRRMQTVYYFTLDYFFWLGVDDVLQTHADDRLRAALEKFQHHSPR